MPDTKPQTAIPQPARRRIHLPRPLWIFMASIALIAGSLGVRFGASAYRQQAAIERIEHFNGYVEFHPRGPVWLREWIGEKRMEWFDEPYHVVFWPDEANLLKRSRLGGIILPVSGPLIDDDSLACLLELPDITSLDLAFSAVSDAGMRHICRLPNLEELRLEGTDVSDASIPLLSRIASLRRLNVENTKFTESGSRKLEAALPDCAVSGPHNDGWNSDGWKSVIN